MLRHKAKPRRGYVTEAQAPTEGAPRGQSWNNLGHKTNEAAFDYNTKHKINMHESMHIHEQLDKFNKERRDKSPLEKNSK